MIAARVETPRQGAIIGGWLCFLLGAGIMYWSLWAFWFYVPILLVAFILSIVAMAQRRILGGVLLLLLTLAVPPVQWIVLMAKRTDEFAREHLPPEQRAAYEAGRELGRQLVRESAEPSAAPEPAASALQTAPAPAKPLTESEAFERRIAQAIDSPAGAPRLIHLTADTAPIVFEFKAARPTPHGKIAEYVLGYDHRDTDEFSRREFVAKLAALVGDWTAKAQPQDLYCVTTRQHLGEYDFDRSAFPTGIDRGEGSNVSYKYVAVPGQASGSSEHSNSDYRICFTDLRSAAFVPVPVEQARSLVPALKESRQVDFTFIGTLARCTEDYDPGGGTGGSPAWSTKLIYLNVSEIRITHPLTGETLSARIAPAPEPAVAGVPPPPFDRVALTSPPPPAMQETAPAASPPPPESLTTLSPEAVVGDVLDPDLRVMARNFQKQYAGKRVRYTETVVRKNPRERLIVFKGGGFLTTAYDVQASLDEEQGSGFDSVQVGTRITIVGTLDRLVPPPFGLGSSSIRIHDAQIGSAKIAARPSGFTPPAAGEMGNRWQVVGVPAADTLTVRAAPAMASAAVFSIANGQEVEVRGEPVFNGDTEWVPIRLEDKQGWVRGKYLKRIDE